MHLCFPYLFMGSWKLSPTGPHQLANPQTSIPRDAMFSGGFATKEHRHCHVDLAPRINLKSGGWKTEGPRIANYTDAIVMQYFSTDCQQNIGSGRFYSCCWICVCHMCHCHPSIIQSSGVNYKGTTISHSNHFDRDISYSSNCMWVTHTFFAVTSLEINPYCSRSPTAVPEATPGSGSQACDGWGWGWWSIFSTHPNTIWIRLRPSLLSAARQSSFWA